MARKQWIAAVIQADWLSIVGLSYRRISCPERVVLLGDHPPYNGKIYLLVENGAALTVECAIPMLINRINTYFGVEIINRIILKTGYAIWNYDEHEVRAIENMRGAAKDTNKFSNLIDKVIDSPEFATRKEHIVKLVAKIIDEDELQKALVNWGWVLTAREELKQNS